MKNYYLVAILLFSGILVFASPLSLTGNVETGLVLQAEGCLAELLAAKTIKADAVLLIGADGTAAFLERSALEMVSLQYANKQWNSISDSLPPVCNIKDLAEIAISYHPWETILEVDIEGTFPRIYTPFSWIMTDYVQLATSSKNGWQAEKYEPAPDPLISSFQGEMSWEFYSGDVDTGIFEQNKFLFNGHIFRYDGKPLKKMFRD
jgi:hypothetical protein